jgi:hypothetical protein
MSTQLPRPYKSDKQILEDAQLYIKSLRGDELTEQQQVELQDATDRLWGLDGLQAIEILIVNKQNFRRLKSIYF